MGIPIILQKRVIRKRCGVLDATGRRQNLTCQNGVCRAEVLLCVYLTILLAASTSDVPRKLAVAMQETRGHSLVQGPGRHEVITPGPPTHN